MRTLLASLTTFCLGLLYQWSGDHELPDPFVNGVNNAKEILVTGLEWLDESLLLVSYMYHGLM